MVWFEEYRWAIRCPREKLSDVLSILNVSEAMLNEYLCWACANRSIP